MLVSLASDDISPVQLCGLSVCNTGVQELQEVRLHWSDKGVADSAENRYSNVSL
jgi:hypothetical protein